MPDAALGRSDRKARALILAAAFGLGVGLGGCGVQLAAADFETTDDLQEGPGLFSGEDGRITVYSGDL